MKKLSLLLTALCLQVLDVHAQQQVFTIDGYVDENITDSCYNIYLADEYFEIQGDVPVANVPVVNKRFTYSIPLKNMTAGRVRCIFPGNKLCSAWIDLFFVPGETVKLTVHNGYYSLDNSDSYREKINREVDAVRKATKWTSPHLPKVKGKVWHDAYSQSRASLAVKDVMFNENETVLRLVSNFHLSNMNVSGDSYLTDSEGNTYRFKRALFGNVNDNNSQDVRIFGGYYAYEPLPKGTKVFTFHEGRNGNAVAVVAAKQKDTPTQSQKSGKGDFRLNIHVTEGINDSGYLIDLYNHGGKIRDRIGSVSVKEKETSFATHLDGIYLADVTATFPDGSVCTHCMRFPFVPGETAELKVMNGSFYLSGTGFYRQWIKADELVENAQKYHKQSETDSLIRNYLKEHCTEEGCVLYYVKNNVLPIETIRQIVPSSILNGRFKQIIELYLLWR